MLTRNFQLQDSQDIFLHNNMVSQDTKNNIKANQFNNMVSQVIKIKLHFKDNPCKGILQAISLLINNLINSRLYNSHIKLLLNSNIYNNNNIHNNILNKPIMVIIKLPKEIHFNDMNIILKSHNLFQFEWL